jgi:myo-inositol 2-dehydrogenase/D-chiro-inositol 1-dehydrogenase
MTKNQSPQNLTRRGVLKAAALVGPTLIAARVLGQNAPSKRITVGFIGVGGHGHGYNLMSLLQQDDCQAVAVCDTSAKNCARAADSVNKKYGDTACKQYRDFREVLADKSIDAVCISTPDHWHVPISIMAAEAGKDVLCEKPTLTIAEGRQLVQTFNKCNKVFQVGLEDRSVIQYFMLAQWVRNGAIGDLQRIIAGLPAGRVVPKEDPIPVPPDFNYELWLGPAPFAPYTKSRTEAMVWRQIRDYSGGMMTDWGAHLVDTAQVANFAEKTTPIEVAGQGEIPKDAMTSTAPQFVVTYRYANGVELVVQSTGPSIRFEGTKGWVGNNGWRGKLEASDEKILHLKYQPEESKLWPLPPSEHRNFLDCVKSRQATTYPAEDSHRLSTVLHLGNISLELGRKLKWDPKAEEFIGDDQANQLRSRVSREDWKKA